MEVHASPTRSEENFMTVEMGPSPTRVLYTPRELQAVLKVQRSKVYELVNGPLKGDVVRVGKLIRVPATAVDRFIAEGGEPRR